MTSAKRPTIMVVVTAAITARLFMRGYAGFLAEQGYAVTLVADDVSEIADVLAQQGVEAHSLPMRRDPSPIRDLRSLWKMVLLMRRVRPDVVVYATPKASMLASVAARLLRVPVRIYELWGIRFETATGAGRKVFRLIERIIASSSTSIIANSESLARQAVALGITSPERITAPAAGSSHGVDSARFSPDAARSELDAGTAQFLERNPGVTIGYIGRLHPDKGVDVLLNAAEQLRAKGTEVRVLLVGGDEGTRLPTHDSLPVHRTGEIEDVRPYLAAFDMLVLMSLREGFPNVVLEAAAMEVPAIVSDATGCVDAVIDGATGAIIPVGNVGRLVDAIERLRQPETRQRMGRAARARVVAEFHPHTVWGAKEQIVARQLRATGSASITGAR